MNAKQLRQIKETIKTSKGDVELDNLRVGDKVVGWDDRLLQKVFYRVSKIDNFNTNINHKYIVINDTHKFAPHQSIIVNGNLVHAKDIQVGDHLSKFNGKLVKVATIRKVTNKHKKIKVTIEPVRTFLDRILFRKKYCTHTYYVNDILVHNASRYWVGGTANWDATAGTKWSATSGGGGGSSVPTASDDVFFDAASGAVTATVSAASVSNNLNFTGFTGTLAGSSGLTVSGSLTLSTGMTRSFTGSITFDATTTGKTITLNGKTLASALVFNGTGGEWIFQDGLTNSNSIGLTRGTLNTNGQTVAISALNTSNSNVRSIVLGASSITVSGNWALSNSTNMTLNAGTSTIIMSGAGAAFQGGSLTYYNVTFTGSGAPTITGANTFNNLTRTGTAVKTDSITFNGNQTISGTIALNGNSATNRLLVASDTLGTQRTLTAAVVSASNIDLKDINGAGAGSWNLSAITGLSGDCGGNTNITFTTGANMYWDGAGTNVSTAARWFLATNGGGGAGRVPLPQDTAIFDANSINAASQTVTQDMPRIGGMDFTGVTNNPTFTTNVVCEVYGSITLVSGMTLTGSTQSYTFSGRGSFTLTSAGKSWAKTLALAAPGGSLTLQDTLTLSGAGGLSISVGTFNTNNQDMTTAGTFSSSGSSTRAINLGSSTINLTGANVVLNFQAGVTFNAGTSNIIISNATATAKTFNGGNYTFHNVTFEGGGTGTLTISGSNTFNILEVDSSALAKTLILTASTTQTLLTDFAAVGSSGKVITVQSTSATNATLTKSSGTVTCDWLALSDITAAGGANWISGTNSTKSDSPGWDAGIVATYPSYIINFF